MLDSLLDSVKDLVNDKVIFIIEMMQMLKIFQNQIMSQLKE